MPNSEPQAAKHDNLMTHVVPPYHVACRARPSKIRHWICVFVHFVISKLWSSEFVGLVLVRFGAWGLGFFCLGVGRLLISGEGSGCSVRLLKLGWACALGFRVPNPKLYQLEGVFHCKGIQGLGLSYQTSMFRRSPRTWNLQRWKCHKGPRASKAPHLVSGLLSLCCQAGNT